MQNLQTNTLPSASEQETRYGNHTDDSDADIVVYQYFYERQMLAAALITIGILGMIDNSFVIVTVALSKKLQTTTNVFVVNLAVADILSCLFTPWQAVAILGGDDWPIPGARWVCTATSFVTVVTFGSSANNLALIAINRWVGVTKSRFTTRRIYTARNFGLMVIFSWGIPLCCALTPVLTDFGELGYEKLYSTCTWDRSNIYSSYYTLLIIATYYPIQLVVITASYASIFCFVRKTSRRMTRKYTSSVSAKVSGINRAMRRKMWKRQLDVTKNLLYIVLAFVICLTPYFTAIIFSGDWTYRLVPWAGVIWSFNSCVNPIIYTTSHPDFKEAFVYMIRLQKIPRGGSSQSTDPAHIVQSM